MTNNKKVLVTGGCGFVGSNIALKLKQDYPSSKVVVLDNLKRRGSELNILRLKEAGIDFIHGDIRNKEDFDQIGEVNVIVEAAAEPSVLSGIDSTPDYVINSNLVGTINCLNFALKYNAEIIFLSTSRVYPIESLNRINYKESDTRFNVSSQQSMPGISPDGINEEFPINGARSFYGTSKLASELFIQEYQEFYGLKAVINRCGVITGPWQMGKIDQGVIVLWLAKHYWKKELSYIGFGGTGKQVRDIIHIQDLYDLIKIQLGDLNKFNKGIFNVGGGNAVSVSLKELTLLCETVTGNKIKINSVNENRVADIPVYISDNSKINKLTGWTPKITPVEIMADIFEWIKSNELSVKKLIE